MLAIEATQNLPSEQGAPGECPSIPTSDRPWAHSLPATTHWLRIVYKKPKANSAAEEEAELRHVVQALTCGLIRHKEIELHVGP
jgi:hypothetical protein